jgi:hypothetical protein
MEAPRDFRLEVNAELVVHGRTEPDATLRIGDRAVPLDADGRFQFRFSFPDGDHTLRVEAISAHTGESRRAELRFQRQTETVGRVGAAVQSGPLKPPSAENL